MADLFGGMTPDEYFRRMSNAMGGTGGSLRAGQSSGGRSGAEISAAEIQKLTKEAAAAATSFTRVRAGNALLGIGQQKLKDAQNDTATALSDLNYVLEEHRKGRQALSKEEKKELESRRRSLNSLDESGRATQAFQSGVMAVAGMVRNIGSTMLAGQIAVASAIQGGGSGFAIALAQLTANTNNQNAMTQALAGAATSAGVALMGFGIAGKLAGGAMMMYAQKVAVESDLRAQATNARNQILLSGGDALLKTYIEATKSGAVLSGGFGQMHASLKGSRYTMEDYSAIVKASGEQLAATGMGVAEASMMIGRVGKVLKDTRMDRQMLALGFSYQEQGQLMAQVMADMRRRDPGREINDKEVAQRTKQYAHDLAVLTEITGKDAKARMEASRKATGQLAFQQFLAGLGKNGEVVQQAMSALSPQIQQNVMDMAVFGNVINKQGAIMTAANPALDAMQRELFDAAQTGKLTNDMAVQIQGKYSKSVNEGMMSNRGLALAMAAPESKLAALGVASQEVREELMKMKDAVKIVNETAKTEANSGLGGKEDKNTKLMLDMTEIGQDIRVAFQDHIISKLVTMGPMLQKVLDSIGKELPGVSSKGVLQTIWGELTRLAKELWKAAYEWGGVWAQGGLIVGALVAALAVAGSVWKTISGSFENIKALFGMGGGSGTTASGTPSGRGGPGPGQYEGWKNGTSAGAGNGRLEPGGPSSRLPSGTTSRIPGGNLPGGSPGSDLGKFGAGIKSILMGLGQGAGGLIAGVLQGLATGFAAIGAVAVPFAKGSAALALAIVVIGGAVAVATWMMGKALPTFAEGLKAFDGIDGKALVEVGKGAGALGLGMAAFGAGSGLAGVGSIISNISDGFIKFFGGKTTLDQFREMAQLGPQLKTGADGITTFAKSMGELLLLDIKKIDTLADSVAKLQKASSGPGFFTSLGNAAVGTVSQIDAVKNAITRGANINQGGAMGAGQTEYNSGKAIVWAQMLPGDREYLIKGITGGAVPVRSPTTTTSQPAPVTAGGITSASFAAMAKSDPMLFALSQLLEFERAKDKAKDGTTSKVDIQIALLDRIAEAAAKTAGSTEAHAAFQKKFNYMLK